MEGKTRLELAFVGFADPAVTNSGALPLIHIYWLGIKDSNLGHPESESGVLPTELIPNNGATNEYRSRQTWVDNPVGSPAPSSCINGCERLDLHQRSPVYETGEIATSLLRNKSVVG
jgi:hypothetical protein